MADSETTVTPGSGFAAGRDVGLYRGTFKTLAGRLVAPLGLVFVSGAIDAHTFEDAPGDAANGLDVDVTRLPADPLGANADLVVAAGATGSISAKLRRISTDIGTAIASLATLAAGVAGNRYQVDIVSGGLTISRPSTSTLSNAAMTTASAQVIAGNANRLGLTIHNDSAAVLYLKYGSTAASSTSFTAKVDPDGFWNEPTGYTGEVRGILAAGTGTARVTELTA